MSMREVARAVFRFAATIEPKPEAPERTPRSAFDPRHLARAGLLTARYAAEAMDALWKGPAVGLAYGELDNKVRAFHLFETVVAGLELPEGRLEPAAAIERAERQLGREQAVWASEGIGYELGERRRRGGQGDGTLLGAPDARVPDGSWAVLHTGLGMSLAEATLARLGRKPTPSLLKQALEAHVASCASASRRGYAPLAFEPLGLVARLLEPSLVGSAAAALSELGEPWSELFWHGVGRGLYFLPANLPPARSSPWAGFATARKEAPGARSRRCAAAGFAWAVTLVNLRRPAVVESFLGQHADAREADDAAASGVVSALTFWHAATGGSKELRRFLGHVAGADRRDAWRRLVSAPAEAAISGWKPGADETEGDRLSELFRSR